MFLVRRSSGLLGFIVELLNIKEPQNYMDCMTDCWKQIYKGECGASTTLVLASSSLIQKRMSFCANGFEISLVPNSTCLSLILPWP